MVQLRVQIVGVSVTMTRNTQWAITCDVDKYEKQSPPRGNSTSNALSTIGGDQFGLKGQNTQKQTIPSEASLAETAK